MTATVTLQHGDSLKLLADIPDASVDCVATDPPYYQVVQRGPRAMLLVRRAPPLRGPRFLHIRLTTIA